MFQTQGSVYELTGRKIFETIPPKTVLVPVTVPVTVPNPEPVPDKHVSMLTRKSTLYQSQSSTSTSYVKYGECDDSDSDSDNHENNKSATERDKSATERDKSNKNHKVVPTFDSPGVKQAMSTMKKEAFAFEGVAKHCNNSAGSKKRFPVPGQSSTMNQLFWCVYIACKGHAEFDMITNAFVRETEFKYETAELARGGKHLIKPAFKKYKMSLPNFEAELISSKRTTLQLMAGIALCHHKPVIYIDGRLFIEIKRSDNAEEDAEAESEVEYTVIEKVKNRYCVYKDAHGTELSRCRKELLKMESIESPVRSISYYKVNELEDMCKRLGLSTGPSKKADLYAEVLKYIQTSGITV